MSILQSGVWFCMDARDVPTEFLKQTHAHDIYVHWQQLWFLL